MMRRVIQIVLLASLLVGSAAQALACDSMVEESHPCCRALATIKATTPSPSVKKVQPVSLKGGSCGCTSAPATPREKPVSSASTQQHHAKANCDDELVLNIPVRIGLRQPVRLQAPNNDSPPHFILYNSLLI